MTQLCRDSYTSTMDHLGIVTGVCQPTNITSTRAQNLVCINSVTSMAARCGAAGSCACARGSCGKRTRFFFNHTLGIQPYFLRKCDWGIIYYSLEGDLYLLRQCLDPYRDRKIIGKPGESGNMIVKVVGKARV